MEKLSKATNDFFNKLNQYHKEERNFIINIPPTEAQEVVNILCDLFLGENWYVVDPLNQKEVNTIILDNILYKYNKYYRRKIKNKGKDK